MNQSLVSGKRENTTVPAQALYLLNASFVRQQAYAVAQRAMEERDAARRVAVVYRRILGRAPRGNEVAMALRFVADSEALYAKTPLVQVAAVKPVVRVAASDGQLPPDPDNVDRTEFEPRQEAVALRNGREAAWMELAQALFAAAEFRFVP